VKQPTPRTTGLSGDLGWPDAEHRSFGFLGGMLLLLASGAYWGTTWLLSGLAPLPLFGRRRENIAERHQASATAHRLSHDRTRSDND
jgi:hypothetical protein